MLQHRDAAEIEARQKAAKERKRLLQRARREQQRARREQNMKIRCTPARHASIGSIPEPDGSNKPLSKAVKIA